MHNNLSNKKTEVEKSHMVYRVKCSLSDSCNEPNFNPVYVGYTTNTLHTRLTQHTYQGSIKEHFLKDHNTKLTLQHLKDNAKMVYSTNDTNRLQIYEALTILNEKPGINKQFETFKRQLKLFS